MSLFRNIRQRHDALADAGKRATDATRPLATSRRAALAALLLLFSLPLHAADTLEKIRASKTITFGYREGAPPFSYTGSDNQPWGYAVDLCTRVAAAVVKRLALEELQLQWIAVTPENRIGKLKAGEIDLECGTTTSSLSRMEEVDFSLTTFVDGGGYLFRRAAGVRRLDDLAGKRIAVVAGTGSERMISDALVRNRVFAELLRVSDHREGMAAMHQGKVDAYASDRAQLIALALASPSPGDWSLGPETLTYEPHALMLRRQDADFRLIVNRELARLYRTREIYDIYDRWFGVLGKPAARLENLYYLNALPE